MIAKCIVLQLDQMSTMSFECQDTACCSGHFARTPLSPVDAKSFMSHPTPLETQLMKTYILYTIASQWG